MSNKSGTERALVAIGLRRGGCIIATDGAYVAAEIEAVGTCWVEDIFGDGWFPEEPGLYLWTGTGEWRTYPTLDGYTDPEVEWDGAVRPVKPEELAELLAMAPPEPAEESEVGHG